MRLTYFGHSCFGVETENKHFLFDPFISGNTLAKSIDLKNIQADYILISHGHSDHVADLMTIAQQTGATVIANFEIINWVQQQGYHKVHPINHGSKKFDFGTLRFVPAHHSSSMPDGTYGGNPGGFLLTNSEGSFYFAGDTSLTMEMKLIPGWARLNFAILPIGGNFTMDVTDAIRAAQFIECKKIVGIHFDTFEVIEVNHEEAKERFEKEGLDLILPKIGETLEL